MSNVEMLPYASARDDDTSVRLPALLTTWFLLTGIVAAATLVTDIVLSRGDSRLAILLDWRRFSDQWNAASISTAMWTVNFCARGLAGVLLLVTAIQSRRRQGVMSPAMYRYIRAAGVLMAVNVLGELVEMLDIPSYSRMPAPPWLWVLTAIASAALMLPQAWILLLGSTARFYRDAELVRRLVGLSAVLAGLLVSLVFAEYLIRWVLGTPPPWMTTQAALTTSGAPLLSRLSYITTQFSPWMHFASALVALICGGVMLLSRGPRNRWLVVLAIGWVAPRAIWLLSSLVFAAFSRPRWSSQLNQVLTDCFACLLPVVACWLAGRGPEEPSGIQHVEGNNVV